MKVRTISVLAAAAAVGMAARLPAANPPSRYKITGPFTHDNLSVYLIHGPATLAKNLLTLEQAISEKNVIVYETRDVNQLTVENVSNQDVFIESGDIVQGGAQDRTFQDDLILPSHSGKVDISAFCVEHGRWTQRGTEPVRTFGSASQAVATKELKMAVRLREDQGEVWRQVAAAQARLSSAMNLEARAAPSPTSLPLTMQTHAVERSIDGYLQELAGAPNHQPAHQDDVIGYAFVIDGKVNSADVYGSHDLFSKLWMKLLRASAVEAVSQYKAGQKYPAGTVADIQALLADADSAQPAVRDLSPRTQVITHETAKTVKFETRDRGEKNAVVHRNYLTK